MQKKQRALRLISLLREDLLRLLDESKQVASIGDITLPLIKLREWKSKAAGRISYEISSFEGGNLRDQEVFIHGVGGLWQMFSGEVAVYISFLDNLAAHINEVTASFVPTGWEKIDGNIEAAQYNLTIAQDTLDFQKIGLVCRETLTDLAQEVFDPQKHRVADADSVSKTHTKRMLEAYIGYELSGSTNEAARKHVKAALDLANALTHHRPANYREAALCLEATISVINITAIISGRRDSSQSP